jgi:hypothetical protein
MAGAFLPPLPGTPSTAEALVLRKARIPSLEETNTATYGRGIKKIHDRTLWIYGFGCFIALLLWALGNFSPLPIPQQIIALACGFFIPGGGFLATGRVVFMLTGAALTALFFTFGFKMLDMFGNTVLCVLIWAAGGLGGLFAGEAPLLWAPLPALVVAGATWTYWAWQTGRVFRFLRASREERRTSAEGMIAAADAIYRREEAIEERELDQEVLRPPAGEALYLEDGIAYMRGIKWEDMVDMSTSVKTPAGMVGQFEQLCLEFGDYEMARGFREAQHKYLVMSNDRFKYQYASVNAMASLATARWSRKDDWYDTILKGPSATAFTGSVLEECSYPEVLVAKAISHGEDLALVLYNGTDRKQQKLNLGRLRKNGGYRIEEIGQRFSADGEGAAELLVNLDGRTPLTIVPAA